MSKTAIICNHAAHVKTLGIDLNDPKYLIITNTVARRWEG